MEEKVEDLTILLLYLTAWDEGGYLYDENNNLLNVKFKNSWKGYSFDALNSLTEKELLYPCKNKTKSVSLTKEGEKYAEKLFEKYFGEKI